MGKKRELHKRLEPFLNCIDFTVSKETYEVMLNPDYEMLVTSPIPVDLENYYKSEDYISHTDSKKSLFDKVYQSVKNYTLKRKLSLINSFKTSSKSILDIGAGTGDFLKVCKNNGWTTEGTEPSIDAVNIAAQKGVFLKQSLDEIENKKYDVITLWHVLEHVEMFSDYVTKLKNLLKEDGKLIIAVPNFKSYDANFYKEYWAAFDVPRHLWHFSQTSIHKIFSEEDMIVEKTIPMKFDSYYVSLLSEKYKSGKMKPFNAFYRGFISNLKARKTSEYSSLIYVIKKY
ncbi:class I SAM-dependent methyltransferase [Polaribacter sp. Z022]|uniref:class I SAM-dependent methyltransferase n=1 Tax=Polaribacter sp. Z022 TaxID=2927125 RepID=UPI0020220E5E|nr:class I SAM-dependent methyltransferase [Polaribacter sp. Z022]MCL7752563.1 class I SAM-dependent methyltransferase [Polaribacter sp. Z022]